MKKRFVSFFLIFCLTLSAISCAQDSPNESNVTTEESPEPAETSAEESEISEEASKEDVMPKYLAACSNNAAYTTSIDAKNGKTGYLTDGLTDDLALYDRGFEEYASSGKAFDITVDLGKVTERVTEYELYYLIDGTSHSDVSLLTVSVSEDGKNFTEAASQKGEAHPSRIDDLCVIKAVSSPVNARYVRFTIKPKSTSSLYLNELIVSCGINADIPDEPKKEAKIPTIPENITVPHA